MRLISWQELCENCQYNGKNHQEYGRLCPGLNRCLLLQFSPTCLGTKREKDCPIWKKLKEPK